MIPGDLELSVVEAAHEGGGRITGFAVTAEVIVAAGGQAGGPPAVLASSNGRELERRTAPGEHALRDVLPVGDAVWACGEAGTLARSNDQGASWTALASGTPGCLRALALGSDGAVWVVGDGGFAARVRGELVERIDLGTTADLAAVYAARDEIIVLGADGRIRRWRGGAVREVATGATRPLTALAFSRLGTWIAVGHGGYIARSPDGGWFSRARSEVETDLEAIATLPDGRLIAVGARGQVLVSADDGRTWAGVEHDLGPVHLWAVERFGDGVLIGGERGLVARAGRPGDRTWSERANVFAGDVPLDLVFAPGPVGFIGERLAGYLEACGGAGGAVTPADAAAFARTYGAPLPDEVGALFAQVAGHDPARAFEQLGLAGALTPDADGGNLFERLVVRTQQSHLATDLVDAFCGVFGIATQDDGDSYRMELYEWDGPRQVLHFDHDTHAFSGVIADSLDSLVFLAALVKAGKARAISGDAYRRGIRALRGRVAPAGQLAFADQDPDFVVLEPKRRDTEFFFYRSRWICALLEHDDVDDVRELFMEDFNQVIPADQLAARFEACERFIPTALYAMWRAYLFDELELAHYLELGRRHAARLVRDAAALIDELRGGRNQLGAITDVRGWLAAFRALDLDPRRAAAREAEAEARRQADARRAQQVLGELTATPEARWPELAWQWVDDGVAHRALLAQLDRGPGAVHLAALDELRDLSDDERAAAIPQLARELPTELEAILVGSLLRDDPLVGVLSRRSGAVAPRARDAAPGWDAIDRVLELLYHGAEPHHVGTAVPYMLGGNDPLHGISAYPRVEPVLHWHFVTYGFTDLFAKETDDPDESGFGFELTFRLARAAAEETPPAWAFTFLQNLARYVFGTGNRLGAGHKMGLNGPIAPGHATRITAVCFTEEPELGDIDSPFGTAQFVQVVGITDDEYRLIQEWSTPGLIGILQERLPLLVTDLARPSVLDDPATAAEVEQRVAGEGSSEDLTFAGELVLVADDGHVRIELGALYAAALPRAMRGRIRHGRPYELRGRDATLHLEPQGTVGYRHEDGALVLEITQELAREIEARLRGGLAGTYDFAAWPALQIVVTPSFIRAPDGTAVDVRGIGEPAEAQRLIAAENARLAAPDARAAPADEVPGSDPQRVAAALGMTERALAMSPDDTDVQFTHAMLLLDGERARLPGKTAELLTWLARFAPSVRINVAVRMGEEPHARFAEAVDLALAAPPTALDDVAHELFAELGTAILAHVPDRLARLVPLVPDDVQLLAELAGRAGQAGQRDVARALYDRVLALPVPADDDERSTYLRALATACIEAHAARADEAAVRLAERAQPLAHEHPQLFHAAACAYAAVGDYGKALEQVRLAIEHDYAHVHTVEVDRELGPLLEWPEFKALFRDWHARQEGN